MLEVGITFWQKRVILWPASAMLTGNGIAFILRVPGTQHGDWWSFHGVWIYIGVAAVSLLSKYLIRFRGRHIFNPSNFGLVLCFLLLGSSRAEPLEFWWGPLSPWLVLALAIIIAGALGILSRLHLLGIALLFWVTFSVAIGVLGLSGHAMSANWHLGPVADGYFWRVLIFSPEVFIFLSFMITDPKTVPDGRIARRVYAVSIGLLSVLLIAPQTTEFGAKVALLASLTIVCAARPILILLSSAPADSRRGRLFGHLATGGQRLRAAPARRARRRRDRCGGGLRRGARARGHSRTLDRPGRRRGGRRCGRERNGLGEARRRADRSAHGAPHRARRRRRPGRRGRRPAAPGREPSRRRRGRCVARAATRANPRSSRRLVRRTGIPRRAGAHLARAWSGAGAAEGRLGARGHGRALHLLGRIAREPRNAPRRSSSRTSSRSRAAGS